MVVDADDVCQRLRLRCRLDDAVISVAALVNCAWTKILTSAEKTQHHGNKNELTSTRDQHDGIPPTIAV